ncbi:hypothetical protein RhiirB3_385154 [Rhizophagus irregularis]|nr:hypothetical protein RhiirB3_385154 [Rhizophagus irregularis]
MCESVLYKCEQLPLNEAFEFIDDQLDQDEFNKYNANSNDNQIDMSNQNKEKIENIEDYYDFRQIYLKALISSVLRKSIKEVKNKGRPNTKRFKAYNEEKNKVNQKENVYKMDGNVNDNDDNVNRRKCDLCHKMGHYTSKYPNKRNS